MKRKYLRERGLGFCKIRSSFPLWEVLILGLVSLGFFPFLIEVTNANQSVSSFKEEARSAINHLSFCLIEPLSKNHIHTIEAIVNETFLEADKKGRPIRFGIGVLDRNGIAVAGGYITGAFKGEDFSKYDFVKKAFKKRKIIQNRLYFQDRSELLIICAPLVQQKKIIGASVPLVHPKKIIGAIVLGFDPTQLQRDYGLSAEQFLALNFDK